MEFLGIKSTGCLPDGLKKCTAREIPAWQTRTRRCSVPQATLLPTHPCLGNCRGEAEGVNCTGLSRAPPHCMLGTPLRKRTRALSHQETREKTEAAPLTDAVVHSLPGVGILALSHPAGCGHCYGPPDHCTVLYLFLFSK